MTEKKFILISMDDEKSKHIADVLGNKTCKKIIDFLAEKAEASEKDIADFLKIPLNTTEYNLKKLIKSGMVETTKNHFWSTKGKRIPTYKLSNKSIIISPKTSNASKVKSILSVLGITAIATILVKLFTSSTFQSNARNPNIQDFALKSAEAGQSSISSLPSNLSILPPESYSIISNTPIWQWFLAGAVLVIVLFLALNWRKL